MATVSSKIQAKKQLQLVFLLRRNKGPVCFGVQQKKGPAAILVTRIKKDVEQVRNTPGAGVAEIGISKKNARERNSAAPILSLVGRGRERGRRGRWGRRGR